MAAPATRLAPGQQQTTRQRLAMTPAMKQSMTLLSMRGMAIARMVKALEAENPFLDVTLPRTNVAGTAGMEQPPGFDHIDHAAVHPVSLAAHLFAAIPHVIRNPEEKAVAFALVEHISPAGWLEAEGLLKARAMGFEGDRLEMLISRLQTIEPAGLFARNLAECLALQIDDRGEMTAEVRALLTHLNHLVEGDAAGLMQATGLDAAALDRALAALRRCNPKPGAVFLHDEGDIFRPDLIISPDGEGFAVMINADSLPEIRLRDAAVDDDAGRILRREAERQMREMTAAIRNRSEMLLAAGAAIVSHQQAFLKRGEIALKPLSMENIADALGCHKSTISRVVADKLCDTPRGMLALRDFFSAELKQPKGPGLASRAVAARITALIDAEAAENPLSDQAIAEILARDGISIARRTVAKYRDQNNIKPWKQRFLNRSV
ncbi:MAG: RNA polymerase factor sigma-54 [Candidatus Puniceispirillales bacterium]